MKNRKKAGRPAKKSPRTAEPTVPAEIRALCGKLWGVDTGHLLRGAERVSKEPPVPPELRDLENEAYALGYKAAACLGSGNSESALSLLRKQAGLWRRCGRQWELAFNLGNQTRALLQIGYHLSNWPKLIEEAEFPVFEEGLVIPNWQEECRKAAKEAELARAKGDQQRMAEQLKLKEEMEAELAEMPARMQAARVKARQEKDRLARAVVGLPRVWERAASLARKRAELCRAADDQEQLAESLEQLAIAEYKLDPGGSYLCHEYIAEAAAIREKHGYHLHQSDREFGADLQAFLAKNAESRALNLRNRDPAKANRSHRREMVACARELLEHGRTRARDGGKAEELVEAMKYWVQAEPLFRNAGDWRGLRECLLLEGAILTTLERLEDGDGVLSGSGEAVAATQGPDGISSGPGQSGHDPPAAGRR